MFLLNMMLLYGGWFVFIRVRGVFMFCGGLSSFFGWVRFAARADCGYGIHFEIESLVMDVDRVYLVLTERFTAYYLSATKCAADFFNRISRFLWQFDRFVGVCEDEVCFSLICYVYSVVFGVGWPTALLSWCHLLPMTRADEYHCYA